MMYGRVSVRKNCLFFDILGALRSADVDENIMKIVSRELMNELENSFVVYYRGKVLGIG